MYVTAIKGLGCMCSLMMADEYWIAILTAISYGITWLSDLQDDYNFQLQIDLIRSSIA